MTVRYRCKLEDLEDEAIQEIEACRLPIIGEIIERKTTIGTLASMMGGERAAVTIKESYEVVSVTHPPEPIPSDENRTKDSLPLVIMREIEYKIEPTEY